MRVGCPSFTCGAERGFSYVIGGYRWCDGYQRWLCIPWRKALVFLSIAVTTAKNPLLWQQGVTSSVFQELTDVWPDPIFVPKVAIA